MAFTVLDYKRWTDLKRVVDLMNEVPGAKPFKFVAEDETKTFIGVGDDENTAKKTFLMVRGWGHLTGVGGLHLKQDEALQIQRDFFNWTCNKLNGKNE